MPLSEGSKIGVYEIISLVGKGGMGEVYCARDPRLEQEVAIKALSDSLVRDEHICCVLSAAIHAHNHPRMRAFLGRKRISNAPVCLWRYILSRLQIHCEPIRALVN